MVYEALEDFFGDIVGKARRGQGVAEADLARAAGLSAQDIGRIEAYELVPDDDQIQKLAHRLNLDGEKLVGVARGWVPEHGNDAYEDGDQAVERLILDAGMVVNCYVLKCKQTGQGALVDAGGQAGRILDLVKKMSVKITHLLLTHGHGDHVGALREVAGSTGAEVFCCERDFSLLGREKALVSEAVDGGWQTQVGSLVVDAVSLPGHTPGGIGYAAEGVFFSGDALFAASMGGARGEAYDGQISAVRKNVLCRGGETRIFPGHGPITTVAQECEHNPFFV